jgi:hypothetical protein
MSHLIRLGSLYLAQYPSCVLVFHWYWCGIFSHCFNSSRVGESCGDTAVFTWMHSILCCLIVYCVMRAPGCWFSVYCRLGMGYFALVVLGVGLFLYLWYGLEYLVGDDCVVVI